MAAPSPAPAAAPLLIGTISDAAFLDRYSVTAPGARVPDMVEARFDLFDGVERAGTADAWLGACARLEESGTSVSEINWTQLSYRASIRFGYVALPASNNFAVLMSWDSEPSLKPA